MSRANSTPPPRKGPGRLTAEHAGMVPERLLDAAEAQFLEKGYARTTMDGIARGAGASTKTVYSRYANKGEVLAAVIRRLVDRTVAKLQADLNVSTAEREPHSVLQEIGMRFAKLVTARQTVGINRLVIAEAGHFPELSQIFLEGPGRAVAIIRTVLEGWPREGAPDVALAATIFYDMVASTPRLRALLGAPMSGAEIERHVAAAVSIFMQGYQPPPA